MQVPHRRRASALMIVFAMMFVLITLVAGLHYRQGTARSSLFHEEANLQARVAAEYELAKQCQPQASFSPDTQAIKGTLAVAKESAMLPALSASKLFDDGGVPDLAVAKTMAMDKVFKSRGGVAWNMISTSSNDPAMRPDRSKFLAVISNAFPYAACAPGGKIQVGNTLAWRNPIFGESGKIDTELAYSGGPARMAADGDIAIEECSYGELHTFKGEVNVEKGRFVAYAGLPADILGPTAYPALIKQQAEAARDKLKLNAQDKTSLFNGNSFQVSEVLKLFKGEGENFLAGLLSLRQAMHFPFFMIPGGRVNGIFVQVWLHMPYAPDGGSAGDDVGKVGKEKETERDDKLKKIDEKQKEIDNLAAQEKSETDAEKKKKIAADKASAEKQKENLATGLQDMYKDIQKEMDKALASSSAETDTGPSNRDGETGMTDKGVTGWSYGPVYKKIFQFCVETIVKAISGQDVKSILDEWAKTLYQEVRLVHFGGKTFDTDFKIDESTSEFTATFNVPPGRAVLIRTNVKIKGDLWLMRGSSLIVQGNLDVVSPLSGNSLDPRKPRGRIFLEEGANLVVSGNLNCEGSPVLGSVLIGAPINQIHPGMSSILVDGNINIPYGVWPAFSLGDIDLKEVPELKTFRDIVATVVPNLAKVSGPFHRRKPYFSSYATTFVVASVLIPPIPVPIIVPVPLPLPTPANINVKIFKALSAIYAVQMNLAWGENFITHTDWWFLGQGTVPIFPKINPTVYLDKIKNFKIPALPTMDQVKTLVADKGPKMVQEMAPKLISEVVVKAVLSQLTMGLGDAVLGLLPLDKILEDLLAEILGVEDTQKSLAEIAGLDSLMNTIKDKISDNAAAMLLFETPGVMIYAGGTIRIAADLSHRVPVTIGMLVAGGDIVSNASVTVGAALSLRGNITLKNLLYDPNCTRCSVYVPSNDLTLKIPGLDWLNWATEVRYGNYYKNTAADSAVDIGPQLRFPSVQGWMQ